MYHYNFVFSKYSNFDFVHFYKLQNDTIKLGSDHMLFNVIKKKVSSYKELSHESIQFNKINTLYDLLYAFTDYEFHKKETIQPYNKEEIKNRSIFGKITFHKYNEDKEDFNKVINTMIQDFKDGIYRVYINGEECTNLDTPLSLKEENEVVFIKLVMLAGRLW